MKRVTALHTHLFQALTPLDIDGIRMTPIPLQIQQQSISPKPMMLVGAGPLISAIWKLGNEESGWRYRFNVVRQSVSNGCVTDLFQPVDLIHFVRLIQVLAVEIANDGCLTHDERMMLRSLTRQLDEILGGAADETEGESTPNTRNNSLDDHKKAHHMAKQPIHEIRHGLIKVRVWRKQTSSGLRHTLTIVRPYRNGDVWKESTRFSRDDIPLICLVLDEAHTWIFENSKENS
ncbi:MAG: hypothetical protein WKF77_32245 [Planctomycetaceae bacterium]